MRYKTLYYFDMKKILILLSAFALAAASFVAGAQEAPQLPNDPAVRVGKLDNGLTYYIRHNDKPAQRAEFYLATNVGAIQETPDQDGLAHFLEHMCFNGTKNFPGKGILNWLQSIGASFGGNVNAATGIDQTQYMLNNIPLVRQTVVDTCLLILHDYSHFVTNDPEEIDKERPVIIEERRSRRNASWRTFEKSLPYLYGDSKYATCTLIGSQENLENFKPESLVNFYRTWYRPDMQAVIVVGDVDVDYTEAALKRIFSDIPKAENPKAKDKITVTPFSEPRVGIITDPETTSPSIDLYWESDADPEEYNSTAIGMMTDLIKNIVGSVMDERFSDITSKPDAPYLGAGFGIGKLNEAMEAMFGSVTLRENNILGGFEAFYSEIEKLKRYGLNEAEVSRAKDNILSAYERAKNQADTRKNPEFISPLVNNFFDNEAYMEPDKEYELAKNILANINAQVLNQVIQQMDFKGNEVIIYSGPEKDGVATPTKEQILSAIAKVEESDIQANAEEVSNEPLMDASALKGSSVKKTSKTIYGATEWTLGNGVKVVVLPTEYKKDQILFDLYKYGGESLIPDEDVPSFDNSFMAPFNQIAGVSKYDGNKLTKMLSGKVVSVNPYISMLTNGIKGSSSVKDLETALQLLYLEYTEPRFTQDDFNTVKGQLESVIDNMEKNPNYVFQKNAMVSMYGNSPRMTVISKDKLGKMSLDAIERNYRKLFADAAGATMVIVGDVDLDALKPLVEKYIGSLPKGKKALKWDKKNAIMFAKGQVENAYSQDMETPMTTVMQLYSSYRPFTVKDETMLSAVSYILDQIYTDTMREEEGGTYGAQSYSGAAKLPEGNYFLQVYFNSKPEKSDKLIELAKDGLRKLAEEGPTDEQFQKTVENFKKNLPEQRINNSYWRGNIESYLRFGYDNDKESEEAVSALSKESIKAAAKALLDSGNFIEVVQRPGKSTE